MTRILPTVSVACVLTSFAWAQSHELQTDRHPGGIDSGVIDGPASHESIAFDGFVGDPSGMWTRLDLEGTVLPVGSRLRLTSIPDGDIQFFRGDSLADYGHKSAFFNGHSVRVELVAGQGTVGNRVVVKMVHIGRPSPGQESLCGADDRMPSSDPRQGRQSPTGCTSWMIADNVVVTAGHCTSNPSQQIHFNVPLSTASGGLQFPPIDDQYAYDASSLQRLSGGIGSDWAVALTVPNSNTGMHAGAVQGFYTLGSVPTSTAGQTIRITGYGTTSSPVNPMWNQVQKTHSDALTQINATFLRYIPDTTGGNSGSPVIHENTGFAIGIHTHAGCTSGGNQGTRIDRADLQMAIGRLTGGAGFPPIAPSDLAAAPSFGQVDLTWSDNSNNETSFRVERSTDGTTFAGLATLGADVVMTSDLTVAPATDYWYRVRAENMVGNSGYSNVVMVQSPGSLCAEYSAGASPEEGACSAAPFGGDTGGSLTSLFASNNGGSVGGALYFDLTASQTLTIPRISVNSSAGAGASIGLMVYRTAGTAVGNELNPAVWTLIGTGAGVSAAIDSPSVITFSTPLSLATGSHGIALVAQGFANRYTNGTGSNQTYSDSALTLTFGTASNGPFSGGLFQPRVGNIAVDYTTSSNMTVNQRYQMLIRASELTNAGRISGLQFAGCGNGTHSADRMAIRLSHVPAGFVLSNTFATNLPNPATVLDRTESHWDVRADEWTPIGLQSKFDYDGTSDLVVEIVTRNNSRSSSLFGFRSDSNTPRVFNSSWTGTLPTTATDSDLGGLRVRVASGCGAASTHGASCAGLEIGLTGAPFLGSSYSFDVSGGVPNASVFFNLGFNTATPYPLELTSFGVTDCWFWHDIVASIGLTTDGAGRASVPLSVTAGSSNRAILYGQFVQLNPGAPGGAAFSGYARAAYGERP